MKNPQCSKSAEKTNENDYIIGKFDHPLFFCFVFFCLLSPEHSFSGLPRNMLLFLRSSQPAE